MPNGGVRHYARVGLIRRGRFVPPAAAAPTASPASDVVAAAQPCEEDRRPMSDQACNESLLTRLIARPSLFRRHRRSHLRMARRSRPWPPPMPVLSCPRPHFPRSPLRTTRRSSGSRRGPPWCATTCAWWSRSPSGTFAQPAPIYHRLLGLGLRRGEVLGLGWVGTVHVQR